ncbi:carbamoyltransferase C-terminal domain-containing protein [Nocardia lijiangensis]|uniref:carbamoyltransferase C-terminal domain-containing protein n=1 Tax=Nocardia lijiangensis TaxID=299618 RepID=UPI003D74D8E4
MSDEVILGVNLTQTSDGIPLDDGAAALFEDGTVTVAIAEERLVRRKHAGGVANAVRYCLAARGIDLAAVDRVAVSLCCDLPPEPAVALSQLRSEGLIVRDDQLLVVPSHHLSHAASAFYPSPFDDAAVIVADNEGSIIGDRTHRHYWHNRLERTSVFLGRGTELRLLRRYGDQPRGLSLGAAYSHFAKWLGFRTHHDAGQVMALAAYGTDNLNDTKVFTRMDNDAHCLLKSTVLGKHGEEPTTRPPDEFDMEASRFLQAESVRQLIIQQSGIDIGAGRGSCYEPDQHQRDVARLIQSELQRALIEIVQSAIEDTGIPRICLAGGVALNCVTNTLIAELPEVEELYIQPAAGDVGQSLGNALWARHGRGTQPRRSMPSCSLGRTYTPTEIDICLERRSDRITVEPIDSPASVAAHLLSERAIIGWFDAGSEFGPRGLGRRSVLGDPRSRQTKERLDNLHKLRAPYRPYAPSILAEEVSVWFDISERFTRVAAQPMTGMLVAPKLRPDKAHRVPAVSFVDRSARLQAVTAQENPVYYDLIRHFAKLTGVPMVLNTSFNASGDPVVETPDDAIESMLKMRLDALIIGDRLVRART